MKIPCPSACPSKQLSFYFTLIVLQGFGRSRKYPHLLFLTLIVFEGFGRSRKYPHESASKLLVHAAFVVELARPLSFSELFAYRTCRGPSVDNVVQL